MPPGWGYNSARPPFGFLTRGPLHNFAVTGLQGIQFLLLYPDGHLVPLRRYVRDFATNPWAVTGAGMHPAIFDELQDRGLSDEQRVKRLCVALTQSPYVSKEACYHGIIYRLPMTAERPDAVYKFWLGPTELTSFIHPFLRRRAFWRALLPHATEFELSNLLAAAGNADDRWVRFFLRAYVAGGRGNGQWARWRFGEFGEVHMGFVGTVDPAVFGDFGEGDFGDFGEEEGQHAEHDEDTRAPASLTEYMPPH